MFQIFTYQNVYAAIKFSTILTLTIISFIVEASKFLIQQSVIIGYMVINFIHVTTPICLKFIDFLTQSLYGLYWLIYVLWKNNHNTTLSNRETNINDQCDKSISYPRHKKKLLYLTDGKIK
jgi:hypothetical protein